ncbi:MAG: KH domain-containing protein [Candidatus Nanoarchaeia archaeon]|nr:KH domain-containing protein [Candidatus Nanoarchaeia archaeon]
MYKEIIKVPKDRIAVLIGKKGTVRKNLEKLFGVAIKVDSEECTATLESEDSIKIFEATPAIRCIARGFNPKLATMLRNENTILEIINIEDYVGDSIKAKKRIKARLIGKEGKARKEIERLTNTHISIYGKTVAILGSYENVEIAKEGVEELLKGAPHVNAFNYIIHRKKNAEQDHN